jgi:hypothetical protein
VFKIIDTHDSLREMLVPMLKPMELNGLMAEAAAKRRLARFF